MNADRKRVETLAEDWGILIPETATVSWFARALPVLESMNVELERFEHLISEASRRFPQDHPAPTRAPTTTRRRPAQFS